MQLGTVIFAFHNFFGECESTACPALIDRSPVGRGEQTANVLDFYGLASSASAARPAGWQQAETGGEVCNH